jgi:hypothetical protein
MNTYPSVKYPRSFVPGKVPTPEQLPFGWIAINHFDGDLFVKRSRSGIGTDVVKVGSGATTTNLIWVTKDGKDTNSGKKQGDAKATIKAAVTDSKEGTVIRVTAGIYEEDNPIKLPPQVSIVGDSLREVTVTPLNDDDLFYVGNGNYITGLSYIKAGNTYPLAIAAFDPSDKQYINQSTYVQNCTNFIPNSIGMKIDGNHALGPLKSMVLDSFTQYNPNGIGISITNEGYAQLVSLFTICSDTSVYCGTGGACDLTNSNSSFGNKALVADMVGPLKYTGSLATKIEPSDFIVEIDVNTPVFSVVKADYNNQTGVTQIYTDKPHDFRRGMSVELQDLAFTCGDPDTFLAPGRFVDAGNLIIKNKQEIVDKSLAAIALDYPDFYFPNDPQTNQFSRYKDSYRLIQKNKQEIVNSSWVSITSQYPALSTTETKCKRDLGYFIDAISTDIFIGGNKYSRDFTRHYFDTSGNPISNGINDVEEINGALVGFSTARELMKGAITNQLGFKDLTITSDPNPLSGISSNTNPASCSNVQTTINNLVGIVTTVIGTSNIGFLNTFSEVSGTFIPVGENKCRRDIGFIVDAVANDLKFNTNFNIINAANYYFDDSDNPISNGLVGEEIESIAAFQAVREYAKLAINNQLNIKDFTIIADPATGSNNNVNSCANVKTTIDNLVGILTTSIGSGTPPGNSNLSEDILIYPSGKNGYIFEVIDTAPGRYLDAATLIESNRKEILDKSLVGIALSYTDFVFPNDPADDLSYRFKDATRLVIKNKSEIVGVAWTNTYNNFFCSSLVVYTAEEKCKRDLGYFVDAISTDLYIGGNYYSIEFVKQYFTNAGIAITNGLVGSEQESIFAFHQARDLMKQAITNQLGYKELCISPGPSVYDGPGGNVGVTSTNACFDVQHAVDTLVGIVTTVIGDGNLSSLDNITVNPGIFLTGENVCRRDLGFVLDAVINDLRTFSNENTLKARDAYFDQSGVVGIASERQQSIVGFTSLREYAKLALNNQLNVKDFTIIPDPDTDSNNDVNSCSDVKTFIDNLVSYLIVDLTNQTKGNYPVGFFSNTFTVNVGTSGFVQNYVFGGYVKNYISRPYDGQVLYFDQLYYEVDSVNIINGGSNYQTAPEIIFSQPDTEWGIPAQAVITIRNGTITAVDLVSSGRGYSSPPTLTISNPNVGINTAVLTLTMKPTYYSVSSSTKISSSGITTITLNENIPYSIDTGTDVYFYKQSRILASSHCMEYIGTGIDIEKAIPVLGGVPIQENETVSKDGGLVVYTTTDQAGNFRIGDGVVINQNTGRISGTDYTKSLFATMTPFILSLGGE